MKSKLKKPLLYPSTVLYNRPAAASVPLVATTQLLNSPYSATYHKGDPCGSNGVLLEILRNTIIFI